MVDAACSRQTPRLLIGLWMLMISTGSSHANVDELREGLSRSFALPWQELYEKRYPEEWRNLLDGVSAQFGLDLPLRSGQSRGQGSNGSRTPPSAALLAGLRYRPLGSWFAELTAVEYLQDRRQQPWNSDFYYRFGFDDPAPYTFSLVYENYTGTRWAPRREQDEHRFNFAEGSYVLGFKLPLRGTLHDFLVPTDGPLNCRLALRLTPRYDRADANDQGHWKQALGGGCRYEAWPGWFVDAMAYGYPRPSQQQAWDPDFTYSFGYSGAGLYGIGISYQNYSGNRWPGHRGGDGSFKRGSLTLSWTWTY